MGDFREDPTWRTHLGAAKREFLGTQLGPAILADMHAGVPVDTGALRTSLFHEVLDEDLLRLGSDLDYSAPVEEGHEVVYRDAEGQLVRTGRYVPAQPYMKPALFQRRSGGAS